VSRKSAAGRFAADRFAPSETAKCDVAAHPVSGSVLPPRGPVQNGIDYERVIYRAGERNIVIFALFHYLPNASKEAASPSKKILLNVPAGFGGSCVRQVSVSARQLLDVA
jgi:hypothetical protein